MTERTERRLTGGCQCGAVRYEMLAVPRSASICHCRMCQRASGQPFMAFAGGKAHNLRWTRGAPTIFKSSDKGERGFCSGCGTPLTYRFEGTGNVSVTINSMDDPEAIRPSRQYGIESKVSWVDGIASLPAQRTEEWLREYGVEAVKSNQHGDR